MDRRQDPRTIVTPYAFSVHPDLLGRPLATPWQRLGAIAIDGLVILGLTLIGGLTLAVASTLLLFWLAIRKPGRDVLGKLFRITVGCLGALILGVTILVVVVMQMAEQVENDPEMQARIQEALESRGVTVDLQEGATGDSVDLRRILSLVPNSMDLRSAETPEEARALMLEMGETARAAGMPLQDIREVLESLSPSAPSWDQDPQEMVNQVMASLRTTLPGEEARAGDEPGAAGAGQEPAGSDAAITDSLALDSIRALNTLVQELDEGRRDVETQLRRTRAQMAALEEGQEGGLLSRLFDLIDELGLGFGWGALYMTVVHAWWRGTSVGKKLLRIRVVMIDKRPLNWWLSFERAGGYAAGLATGLLGFAQVFWDPNRQAIHDKVSETIVIQDGKPPVPGPWMEQGKAQWERNRDRAGPRGVQN